MSGQRCTCDCPVHGRVITFKQGQRYRLTCTEWPNVSAEYIYARVGSGMFRLISLTDGNRFRDEDTPDSAAVDGWKVEIL